MTDPEHASERAIADYHARSEHGPPDMGGPCDDRSTDDDDDVTDCHHEPQEENHADA